MKSALPIFGQWPPAQRVLDIFQQLILPKTMYIRTVINFLGLTTNILDAMKNGSP